MAHNKLYRNFIILQEDERGYSHSNDKTLSGYAKVEAKGDKCKVSFYAQNLRQEDDYSMVLICCKRDLKQLIDLGPLAINEVGKGDTSKEYYVNNIAGLGISYEKISGAAICRMKNSEPEFIMHGFMNGEESADNWRKFKFIKADSKKYINKLDSELPKKDMLSPDIISNTITPQVNEIESNIKTSKLQNEFIERNNLETTENLEDERHKNKETKKCEKNDKIDECEKYSKYEKYDKCDKCDKHDKYEKYGKCDECDKLYSYEKGDEDIEAVINKLFKELDTYDGIIDATIDYNHDDIVVYGFIKDKKDYSCEWKKFKLEKECRGESQDFINAPSNSNRLQENFVLDKLTGIDDLGRKDIIDFDKYENDIKKINPIGPTGEKGQMGPMGPAGENGPMGPMGPAGEKGSMGPMGPAGENGPMGPMGPAGEKGSMGPMGPAGEKGSMGPMGPAGEKGSMGPMGPMGPAGEKGSMGPMGPMGPMNTECQTKTIHLIMKQPKVVKEKEKCHLDKKEKCKVEMEKMPPICTGGTSNKLEFDVEQQPATNYGFSINGEITLYFEKLAEDFQPYSGSLTDINRCKWYKINVDSIEDLSDDSNYNQYTLAYYPMLNYYPYISKSGYFLLGYKCNRNGDIQYIVYGIPGSKEKNDQPYGGRTGFVTWTNDNSNGRGYWLMFYDFKNSSIVIPTK